MSLSEDPGFADLTSMLRSCFLEQMKSVHTMLPGKVQSFNAGTGRAVIVIGPAQGLKNGQKLEFPPLIDVPVQFARFGGYAVTMPVNAGDTVAVFFSERSMDNWLRTGQTGQVPAEGRFFSLSDGFAVPGLWSSPPSIGTALELKAENGSASVAIQSGGNVTLHAGALTLTVEPSGKVHATNATGELTLITQTALTQIHAALTLLIPSVTPGNLGAYNTALSNISTANTQRSSFV